MVLEQIEVVKKELISLKNIIYYSYDIISCYNSNMKDYKLKIILSMLAGIIFSFVFIILAFVLPTKKHEPVKKIPKSILEKVSGHLKK